MDISTTKITRTGRTINYVRHSDELSEMVKRGLEAKREKIIELKVKRGQVEDVIKDITREIKELEKTKRSLQSLLRK